VADPGQKEDKTQQAKQDDGGVVHVSSKPA
jgi:hypothetical protein